jgi:hypothetical protein
VELQFKDWVHIPQETCLAVINIKQFKRAYEKTVPKQEVFACHNSLKNINHAFLINRNCLGHQGKGSGCILYVFYLLTTESSDWL